MASPKLSKVIGQLRSIALAEGLNLKVYSQYKKAVSIYKVSCN